MGRKREHDIQCGTCANYFSRRSYHRHKYDIGCHPEATATQPTSEEKTEFLRQLAADEIENLGNGDGVFFDELQPSEETFTEVDMEPDADIYTGSAKKPNNCTADSIVSYICTYLLSWQTTYHVTDAALGSLLRFLCVIIMIIACKEIGEKMPQSVKKLRQRFGKLIQYTSYVVCPGCKHLYKYDQCYIIVAGQKVPKPCPHVEFPNSPKRKICGELLLMESKDLDDKGHPKLVPYKQYLYQSLRGAISNLVQRPGFEDMCEEWKNRQKDAKDNVMSDIYDGQIWKKFASFFSKERRYGLMLNIDFFQPFKHVNYSVGAIYLVILNLPPEERFKKENVILVGLIPKFPSEPPTNTFLQPLVDELKEAWTSGFQLRTYRYPDTEQEFRLALISCGCDIPASRKVCGFLGHMARLGCNQCYKEFPGALGNKCYGGFDRQNWQPRTNATHREDVDYINNNAKNLTERRTLESLLGVRYSVLLELEYFDPVRMCVIDPMHNLFLGTAKYQIRVWKEDGLITSAQFDSIQDKIDRFECPSDVGKIPHKIASGFSSLTADQLKNWVLLFSMPALQGILSKRHLRCWRKFARACQLLCTKVIDLETIKEVDRLLLEYCEDFEKIYGSHRVTPNMHLHSHVMQCVLDFGPIYGFWLFSFERYNGILGNYSTNRRNIEAQLFKRFTTEISLQNIEAVAMNDKALMSVLEDLQGFDKTRGSLLSHTRANQLKMVSMCTRDCLIRQKDWYMTEPEVKRIASNGKPATLTDLEFNYLTSMYSYLYGDRDFELCPSFIHTKAISYMGQTLGSVNGRSQRSKVVYANWCADNGDINTTHLSTINRPGMVEEYLMHKMLRNGDELWHVLAKVNWYAKPSENIKKEVGDLRPSEVWSTMFVDPGPAVFIPVQRIKCKAVTLETFLMGRKVLFVSPRQRYLVCE